MLNCVLTPEIKATKRDFWKNIPDDCKKAINELKRLKVFNLCGFDYEETFADVWWLVLHEVDLYEEGEFCREASRSVYGGDPEAMNLKQAVTADKWLVRWWELAHKYSQPECFSDYFKAVHSGFGIDGIPPYGGQLI